MFGVVLGFQIMLCFSIDRVADKPPESELGVLGMGCVHLCQYHEVMIQLNLKYGIRTFSSDLSFLPTREDN